MYAETYSEENKQWEICAPSEYKSYGNRTFEEKPWVFEFNDWRSVDKGRDKGWLFVWDENTDWLNLAISNNKAFVVSNYEDEPRIDVWLMDWDVGRDYALFNLLAGVRGGWGENIKTIDDPRGIPSDCSEEYQFTSDRMDSDGHSHSYLSANEILGNVDKDNFISMYNHAVELKERADGNGNNARFVFFFDN